MKIAIKFVQFLCIIAILFMTSIANVTVIGLFKFILFAVIVLGAGYVLSRKMNCSNSSEIYAFSLGFGMFFLSALFMLFKGLNLLPVYFVSIIVLALYGVYLFYIDFKKDGLDKFKISNALLSFTLLMLVLSCCLMTLNNLPPNVLGYGEHYVDLCWNLGNINSLKLNFPPTNIRMANEPFNYHFLSMLFQAVASEATGIEASKVLFSLVHFLTVPFLIFSLYSLGKRFLQKEKSVFFYLVVFYFTSCASVFFSTGNQLNIFNSQLTTHIMIKPNGMNFALPFLLLGALVLIKILDTTLTKWGYVGLCLLTLCCTLSKGPIGTMLLGAAIGIVLINLLYRRKLKASVIAMLIILLSVALIFGIFMTGEEINSGKSIVSLGELLKNVGFWQKVCEPIFVNGISFIQSIFSIDLSGSTRIIPFLKQIWFCISVLLYFIFNLIFASIPFLLFTIKEIFNLKKTKQETLVILGIAGTGIVASLIFSLVGNGQIYYAFGYVAFVELAAVVWLSSNFAGLNKIFKVFICVSFAIAAVSLNGISVYLKSSSTGINNLLTVINKSANLEAEPTLDTITKYEYEAMQWLNKNSDEKSIVATDRHYNIFTPNNYIPTVPNEYYSRYYYFSAYSCRQMFLEGWAYTNRTQEMIDKVAQRLLINNEFYNPNFTNREDLLRQNNISYIIVSRFINPNLEITDESLEKVFTNRDIDIYKLKG